MSDYAELCCTTNFSFLRGGSHPQELVAQAKHLGLAALGITDRNSLAGVVRAHGAGKELGLKVIIGARLVLSQSTSSSRRKPGPKPVTERLTPIPQQSLRDELGPGLRRDDELGRPSIRLIQNNLVIPGKGAPSRPQTGDPVRTGGGIPGPCSPLRSGGDDNGAGKRALGNETRDQAELDPTSGIIELLAYPTTRAAYGRLCRLLSRGQLRANKGECILVLDDIADFAEGLIFALMPQSAQHLESIRARIEAPLYLAISHTYAGQDRTRLARLAKLARRSKTPLLAINDVLYHHPDRRPLQDVVTAIREGVTVAEAGYRLEANAERHLKPPAEMARLFQDYPEAIANTLEIAAACTFSLDELKYEYPEEPVPPGTTPQQHLETLAWEGAAKHYPEGVPSKIRADIQRELMLIEKLGYAAYFLTVHDIVNFARSQDPPILCQGRGSAANSAVCFCLGITSVNPAEINLLFERFLTEERGEPPDIDVDFEHERREEVIQYIYKRYGRERAGLAATVICYRSRSAVREVGKVMGLSEDVTSALAGIAWGYMPEEMTKARLTEAGLDAGDPLLARVIELAEEITEFPRHLSQHVGGFVLTRSRLDETVPIGNAAMEERTVIEWDKDDIDTLGILKVDVLGLGMLTCIRKCFELIEAWYGLHYELATIPRDDKPTYDMLCKADSVGVFQVESRAQMNMLPRLRPRIFYDLVIEVAIVRPGPIQGDMVHPYLRRRKGIEPEEYPAPHADHGPSDELRHILGRTKGVPLFQEQAMKLAMVAAKFTPKELNELRSSLATFRHRGTIGLLEQKMVSRMTARGYDPDFAQRCFSQIKGFGEYGFPESHAASFALLVYVSAWIKCHYPAVFAAALLNSQPMGFYAPAQIVRDAREHGVEVNPPDVNHSDWDSTLESSLHRPRISDSRKTNRHPGESRDPSQIHEDSLKLKSSLRGELGPGLRRDDDFLDHAPRSPILRLGLREVDGLNEDAAKAIATARPHHTLASIASAPALEKLAAADAFRSLGLDRRQALWEVKALAKAKPLPLFAFAETHDQGTEDPVLLPGMPLSEHVVQDYQTLKLSLKAHPMSFLRGHCARERVSENARLPQLRNNAPVAVAGVVLIRQRPGSAKGVVFITLEDETGVCNIVVWPPVLEAHRATVMGARLMLVRGRIQSSDNVIHVVADRIENRTAWLSLLTGDGALLANPLARADEGAKPGQDQRNPPRRHPRNVRIIPKSRDFR